MTETASLTREHNGVAIPAAGVYEFDLAHSSVEFVVRHMMVTKVRGRFAAPAGTFTIGEDPADSSVEVTIDVSTISTGDANRDAHLKSPDFFDAETYPTATFSSTGVRHIRGEHWALDGTLTIQKVTKPVTLDLEVGGAGTDPYGNVKVGFSGSTKINREDFGLTWNAALETGGFVVGKDVTIEVEVEASRKG